MKSIFLKLVKENEKSRNVFRPLFFHLTKTSDKTKLSRLIKTTPGISIFDKLNSQLEELIKSQHPQVRFTPQKLVKTIEKHMGKVPHEEYGVWVYYPWSRRLVHILDEKEFIEVRTNRNIYKITIPEREKLAQQKIGVIGLSVGQSVSVTMAMERGFGEIRLADFDLLELTNMNRIRTGVHNLGIHKTISVAREISEIDPFLKVVCYSDGLNEKNMTDFFLKGGKLDVLIDECDSFDMKVLCRLKAKELKIPVLMEASDRGMIDIERFDLEPDRELLHGKIRGLDLLKLKMLKTNEEKIPYMLAFIGIETISDRLKMSMHEIGKTITTWPQLASAVTLGGGITADVCRRVVLGHFKKSGRFYVDVEQIVGD